MENQGEKLKKLEKVYKGAIMSEKQLMQVRESIERAKEEKRKIRKAARIKKGVSLAAAIAIAFVILPNTSQSVAYAMSRIPLLGGLVEVVTFRDYQYSDERNMADVKIPEIVLQTEQSGEKGEALQKSADEINEEIREITDKFVTEFEENLKKQGGYQDIVVNSEVVSTTEKYFTLKLLCYQGAGSGTAWNYYYTIDLTTGKRLALADLFVKDSNYKELISENIKEQMRAQMAQDENKYYWLDNEEIPEWNFQSITEDTAFYLNAKGNLVISFNEGDVAPMYMGIVEFEIPDDVIEDIRAYE